VNTEFIPRASIPPPCSTALFDRYWKKCSRVSDTAESEAKARTTALKDMIWIFTSAQGFIHKTSTAKQLRNPFGRRKCRPMKLAVGESTAIANSHDNHVVKALRKQPTKLPGRDQKPPVTLMSNVNCQNHRPGGGDSGSHPRPHNTGMHGHRIDAMTLRAPGESQILTRCHRRRWTIFLGGLELWSINRHNEGGEQLLQIILWSRKMLPSRADQHLDEMETSNENSIQAPLREEPLEPIGTHLRRSKNRFLASSGHLLRLPYMKMATCRLDCHACIASPSTPLLPSASAPGK